MEPLYSPQGRAERLIAAGRVALALAALLSVWLNPDEPARYPAFAYSLLLAYVLYSLALAVLVWRKEAISERHRLISQAVDLASFCGVMLCTAGTTNPFTVYFVFAMVCGTLRWQWRGALWTAAVSLACFLAIGFHLLLEDADFDPHPLAIRGLHLVLIAVLLAYMGFHEERTRREISHLAAWPPEVPREIGPLVRTLLAHVSRTLEAPRALLAWVEREEPWLYLAIWDGQTLDWSRTAPGESGSLDSLVSEPLQGEGFLCRDAARSRAQVLRRTSTGLERWRGAPLDPELRERFSIRAVLALALRGESIEGWLFLLDRDGMTSDDLVLGEIAAGVVAARLDHFYLDRKLQAGVAMEERIRLARDLHDGVLQSLTGIGLRLAAVRGRIEEDPRSAWEALESVQRLLVREQRELRFFIQELRPQPRPAGDVSLAFRLTELAHRIEQEWGLRAELRTEGLEDPIPEALAREVYHLVREALVNAARHGEASAVRLEIRRPTEDRLSITVVDNGRGFPFQGKLSHAVLAEGGVGPRNLFERVSSLGGTLDLESGAGGAHLEIALPCCELGA